jgi:SNF2 family DNA or RNA helicase
MQLRDYQIDISSRGAQILKDKYILCLAMEVRLGKTFTSLEICRKLGYESILFLTKKKAISSIESDAQKIVPNSDIVIINYESIHKVNRSNFDVIICDESHTMSAFPKPSLRTKQVRNLVVKCGMPRVILLSGTITPESYSQIYHQFWVHPINPFNGFTNFYRWADVYVNKFQKKINGLMVNDYSYGKEKEIMSVVSPYIITYTQKEAGFSTEIEEEILTVEMPDIIKKISDKLEKDLVVEGNNDVILADTPAKLMQKMHQLAGGTIKFESGRSMVLSTFKAEFLKSQFATTKIGVFYKFKEELNALKKVYGDDMTTDLDEFNTGKYQLIGLQIVSGREGISLKNADYLVFYSIDFSAVSYWQARDRMTTMDRLANKVYWIFTEGSIEEKIYKAVKSKKSYTLNIFKKDYGR